MDDGAATGQKLDAACREAQQFKLDAVRASQEREALRGQLDKVSNEYFELQRLQREAAAQERGLSKELEQVCRQRDDLKGTLAKTQASLDEALSAASGTKEAVKVVNDARQKAEKELAAACKQRDDLQTKLNKAQASLDEALSAASGTEESAKLVNEARAKAETEAQRLEQQAQADAAEIARLAEFCQQRESDAAAAAERAAAAEAARDEQAADAQRQVESARGWLDEACEQARVVEARLEAEARAAFEARVEASEKARLLAATEAKLADVQGNSTPLAVRLPPLPLSRPSSASRNVPTCPSPACRRSGTGSRRRWRSRRRSCARRRRRKSASRRSSSSATSSRRTSRRRTRSAPSCSRTASASR